jgi:membrane protease YdiL (CAAX protease family)
MFAAVFAISRRFGILYRRSGNLRIIGVMHAIGNADVVTSLSATMSSRAAGADLREDR